MQLSRLRPQQICARPLLCASVPAVRCYWGSHSTTHSCQQFSVAALQQCFDSVPLQQRRRPTEVLQRTASYTPLVFPFVPLHKSAVLEADGGCARRRGGSKVRAE